MSKLTKPQAKLHAQAVSLLSKPHLTYDDKLFILDNWQESAQHVNSATGAFFTPQGLARDLSIYTPDGGTLIDLCAGIGTLAFYAQRDNHTRIVCVEINPDYVSVGKKILPEAEWICGDVFDLPEEISSFNWDCVISNPPFGKSKNVPLQGVTIELNILSVAIKLSRYGVFILPQMSCPFAYSGRQEYTEQDNKLFDKFTRALGHNVNLECSSIDCSVYREDWKLTAPSVEIAMFNLTEQRLQEVIGESKYSQIEARIEEVKKRIRQRGEERYKEEENQPTLEEIWEQLEILQAESDKAMTELRVVMKSILKPENIGTSRNLNYTIESSGTDSYVVIKPLSPSPPR